MNPISTNLDNRAMCSVFISCIEKDIAEDALKALFSELGQVLNFRVIPDKSSNKSKIAFCEYKDPIMAVRAVHSLNGCELKGQAIHVDLATSEKCRQEIEKLQGNIEPVGVAETPDISPDKDKAPEEISKAVASLPAEQMFELMKQMRMCIENNPQEARNLLLQNPQLAYALLQAQVIMRIVDPQIAIQIFNRPSATELNTEDKAETVAAAPMSEISSASYPTAVASVAADPMTANLPMAHPDLASVSSSLAGSAVASASVSGVMPGIVSGVMPGSVSGVMSGILPGVMSGMVLSGVSGPQNIPRTANQFSDQDLRMLGDQDLRTLPNLGDHDMRAPPAMAIDKDMRQPMGDQDFRTLVVPTTAAETRPFDPRFRNIQGPERSSITGFDRPRPTTADPRTTTVDPRTTHDPRNPVGTPRVEDPRKASLAASINLKLPASDSGLQNAGPNATQPSIGSINISEEQEKAALIMQVLQLTDQQIAALPPEQRQSILVLKEQLIRSQVI